MSIEENRADSKMKMNSTHQTLPALSSGKKPANQTSLKPKLPTQFDQSSLGPERSSNFNSVDRDYSLNRKAFLKAREGADAGKYNPKYDVVQARVTRNLSINVDKKVRPRQASLAKPLCIADDE